MASIAPIVTFYRNQIFLVVISNELAIPHCTEMAFSACEFANIDGIIFPIFLDFLVK